MRAWISARRSSIAASTRGCSAISAAIRAPGTSGVYRPARMRVGIQLPEVERDVRWPEYAAMARAAEEVGFESIWLGDHLLYRGDGGDERGPWDAWTMLAALAAETSRVRLGPLVACASFHPPGLIARMAAAIDEISGGRLVLGLGAGWNRAEYDAFGLPFDHRVSRFEEAFAIIRPLIDGERVSLDGRFWSADDAVLLPPPARRMELMIGSNGPRMLSIALPHAQWWNTWFEDFGNRPEGFAELNARISEAAEAAGRAPGDILRSGCLLIGLEGRSERRYGENPVTPITGSPDAIAAVLRELADAGADEAILVVDPLTERSVRALGEVVAQIS